MNAPLPPFTARTGTDSAELAARGYEDVRPAHEFAMRTIAAGADSASALGRRMSVSKQAAAKMISVLLERGYVSRERDPADLRRKRLTVSPLGHTILREGETIFNELRARWEQQLGSEELAALESQLRAVIRPAELVRPEAPGWVASELG